MRERRGSLGAARAVRNSERELVWRRNRGRSSRGLVEGKREGKEEEIGEKGSRLE